MRNFKMSNYAEKSDLIITLLQNELFRLSYQFSQLQKKT